ncbi:endonuclease III [Thermosphaera chiliense]|uniref:Endonuclease III n=1 Tax=Thermosphaera chiliense TaxID=3402707 RepID=A0A7M1UP66_9CREN|nr:endonuclease III [Thermosphaera aggregans]QOR93886.1 endonuclease III [Thermosphaera aggregans]
MNIGDIILEKLEKFYKLDEKEFTVSHVSKTSLFEFIIAVVLSQNTLDKNAVRALENLRKNLGVIDPEKILNIGNNELTDLIKPAGMYRERSRVILELAKIFSENGFEKKLIEEINKSDVETSRKILTSLPGVGPKTADVVLLAFFGKPVFPVDTHIRRITKRLGYVRRDNYYEISGFWSASTSQANYMKLHLLLITHGRRTCRAIKPLCSACPITSFCEHGKRVV